MNSSHENTTKPRCFLTCDQFFISEVVFKCLTDNGAHCKHCGLHVGAHDHRGVISTSKENPLVIDDGDDELPPTKRARQIESSTETSTMQHIKQEAMHFASSDNVNIHKTIEECAETKTNQASLTDAHHAEHIDFEKQTVATLPKVSPLLLSRPPPPPTPPPPALQSTQGSTSPLVKSAIKTTGDVAQPMSVKTVSFSLSNATIPETTNVDNSSTAPKPSTDVKISDKDQTDITKRNAAAAAALKGALLAKPSAPAKQLIQVPQVPPPIDTSIVNSTVSQGLPLTTPVDTHGMHQSVARDFTVVPTVPTLSAASTQVTTTPSESMPDLVETDDFDEYDVEEGDEDCDSEIDLNAVDNSGSTMLAARMKWDAALLRHQKLYGSVAENIGGAKTAALFQAEMQEAAAQLRTQQITQHLAMQQDGQWDDDQMSHQQLQEQCQYQFPRGYQQYGRGGGRNRRGGGGRNNRGGGRGGGRGGYGYNNQQQQYGNDNFGQYQHRHQPHSRHPNDNNDGYNVRGNSSGGGHRGGRGIVSHMNGRQQNFNNSCIEPMHNPYALTMPQQPNYAQHPLAMPPTPICTNTQQLQPGPPNSGDNMQSVSRSHSR